MSCRTTSEHTRNGAHSRAPSSGHGESPTMTLFGKGTASKNLLRPAELCLLCSRRGRWKPSPCCGQAPFLLHNLSSKTSVLAPLAALRNYHKQVAKNDGYAFSHGCGGQETEVKVLHGRAPSEGLGKSLLPLPAAGAPAFWVHGPASSVSDPSQRGHLKFPSLVL